MKQSIFESILGMIVLCIAIYFIVFMYRTLQEGEILQPYYTLYARFHNIGNMPNGSNICIAGARVGTVFDHYIDQKSYQAILVLHINKSIHIPKDSTAIIVGSHLIRNFYLSIQPGISTIMLKNKEFFTAVKDFSSIEEMIGKAMFSL